MNPIHHSSYPRQKDLLIRVEVDKNLTTLWFTRLWLVISFLAVPQTFITPSESSSWASQSDIWPQNAHNPHTKTLSKRHQCTCTPAHLRCRTDTLAGSSGRQSCSSPPAVNAIPAATRRGNVARCHRASPQLGWKSLTPRHNTQRGSLIALSFYKVFLSLDGVGLHGFLQAPHFFRRVSRKTPSRGANTRAGLVLLPVSRLNKPWTRDLKGLCFFHAQKANARNNILRALTALLKAAEFIPIFARKLIWAPVLSRKGSSAQGSWAKTQNSKTPFFYSQNTAKIWYRTRQWFSSWTKIMMLEWTFSPDFRKWSRNIGDFTSSEEKVSTPAPCLSSLLTFSSTYAYGQVSRINLENTDTGQEQFKPANKFNAMQTFVRCGMDCAKRIELIPLPSCKERIKSICKPCN